MINRINGFLNEAQPFILMVALIFAVMAAWLALGDIFPVIKQVWSPKGSAQSHAIVAACLAIVAGKR